MYKFIEKNQKKLLAIFAAGLMVVFILPNRNSGGMDRDNVEMGTLDGKTVKLADYEGAQKQWKILNSIPVGQSQMGGMESLPAYFLERTGAGALYGDLMEHPDLFFLLLKEADARGIVVAPERVTEAVAGISAIPMASTIDTQRLRPAIESFMRLQVLIDSIGDAVKISEPALRRRIAEEQQVKLNVVEFDVDSTKSTAAAPSDADLQAFFERYARLPAGAPATQPGALSFGYRYPDRVKLQYISVPREQARQVILKKRDAYDTQVEALQYYLKHQSDFVAVPSMKPATTTSAPTTTTAPTTEAVGDEEGKSEPAKPQAADAPAAVKCGETGADIRIAADTGADANPKSASKQPDVKGDAPTTVFEKPPKKVQTTQSTTAATTTTAPATTTIAPTTSAAATSKPTTRPFDEVKDQILSTITKDAVDKLLKQIQGAVADRVASDYDGWKTNHPTTTTLQPSGYPSFEYLQKLADDIQKEFGVRLTVVDNPKAEKPGTEVWIPVSELFELPSIGSAMAAGELSIQDLVSRSVALTPPTTSKPAQAGALAPWQFSPVLTGTDGIYYFRITDAQQAHPPTEMAEVKSAVESDLRLSRAYAKALDGADALLTTAKTQGLASAALASKQKVITTGYFDRSIMGGFNGQSFTRGAPLPGLEAIPEGSKTQLVTEGVALLAKATPDDSHPMTVVKIPEDRNVFVVELAGVSNQFAGADGGFNRARLARTLETQAAAPIKAQWFGYDAVVARTNWKAANTAMTRPTGGSL